MNAMDAAGGTSRFVRRSAATRAGTSAAVVAWLQGKSWAFIFYACIREEGSFRKDRGHSAKEQTRNEYQNTRHSRFGVVRCLLETSRNSVKRRFSKVHDAFSRGTGNNFGPHFKNATLFSHITIFILRAQRKNNIRS